MSDSFIFTLGPDAWHKDYPIAQGNRQSPIDIVPGETVYDANLPPLFLNYDHCTSINISNNGHSVVVEFDDSDDRTGEQQRGGHQTIPSRENSLSASNADMV